MAERVVTQYEEDPTRVVDLESDGMGVNDQQGFLGNKRRSHLGSESGGCVDIVPPKKASHLKENCPSQKESGDRQGTNEEDCCSQLPHSPIPCTEESDGMGVNDQQGFLGNKKRSHLGSVSGGCAEIVPPKKASHLKENCPPQKESGDRQGTNEEDCCSQLPHSPIPCTEENGDQEVPHGDLTGQALPQSHPRFIQPKPVPNIPDDDVHDCWSMNPDKVPSDSEPMSEAYRKSLYAVRPEFEEKVLVNNILSKVHMDAGGFLNDHEEEEVTACSTNREKMRVLLKTLRTKKNKDFVTFCEVLESSGYQHFATKLKKAAGINCKPPKDPGPEATHKILKEKKVAYSLHPVIEKLKAPFCTVVSEFRKQVRPLSDDLYDDVVTLCQTTMAAKAHVSRLPDVPSHRKGFIDHMIKHTTFFDIQLIHEVANLLQQPTLTKAVVRYEAALEPLMRTTIAGLTDRCEVMPINQDSPKGTCRLVLKFPDDANVKDLYEAKDYLEKVLHIPDAKLMAFDFGCIFAYFKITCTPNTLKDLPKRFTKHSDQLQAMGISGAFLIDHWAWSADSDDVWYTDDESDGMEVNDQQGFLGNKRRSHLGSESGGCVDIVPPKKASHLKENCPSQKESGDRQGTNEEDCCSQLPHSPIPCTEETNMVGKIEQPGYLKMEIMDADNFLDHAPSDEGLFKVLQEFPYWVTYVLPLGLEPQQVDYFCRQLRGDKGVLALRHWRDGHCGEDQPGTWRFLLKVIGDNIGPVPAADLEKRVSHNSNWTLPDTVPPGDCHCFTGMKSSPTKFNECISKLKEFYLEDSVIQDDLLEMNPELKYLPLSYVKVKKKTDEKEKERLRDPVPVKYEPVEYDDIISSVAGGQKCVLLQGGPGSGKSTTLRKICHDFAKSNLPPEIKVVVRVILGELEEGSKPKMEDLMQTCISEKRSDLIEEITYFAQEHHGEGVLFLFDGFDGLARDLQKRSLVVDILKGKAYPRSSYIITSRPSTTAQLPPQAVHQMDHVETQGFTEDEMEQFIQQWFQTRPDTGKKVIETIIDNSKLRDMCRNPLTVLIACTIASEEQMLPDRMTVLLKCLMCLLGNSYLKKKGQDPSIVQWEDLEEQCSSFKEIADLALHGFLKGQFVFTDHDSSLPYCPSKLDHMGLFKVTSQKKSGVVVKYYQFFHSIVQDFMSACALSLTSSDNQTAFWGEHLKIGPIIDTEDGGDRNLSLFADQRLEAVFQFYAGLTSLRDAGIQQLLFNMVDTGKGLVLDRHSVASQLIIAAYESQNEEITERLFSLYKPSLIVRALEQPQAVEWCLRQSSFSLLSLNDVRDKSLKVIKQVFNTSKERLEEVDWTTGEHGGEFALEAIAKCTKLKVLILKGKWNEFSSKSFLNVLTKSTSLQSLSLRRVQLLDMDVETIVGDISRAIVQLIDKNLSDVTLEECCDELTRGVVDGVKGLDHKCSLTISAPSQKTQLGPSWMTQYMKAIERQGSVSLNIIRCVLVGPPKVGKSCLKHLLFHNEPKEVTTSTPVLESPEVVTFTPKLYISRQGSSSMWQPINADEMGKMVKKWTTAEQYNFKTQETHSTMITKVNQGEAVSRTTKAQKTKSAQKSTLTSRDTVTESDPMQNKITAFNPQPANLSELPSSFSRGTATEKTSAQSTALQSAHDDLQLDLERGNLSYALDQGELTLIHVLDSGGQPAFQDTLPLLIGTPCTYVAVFNASVDLDQPVDITYRAQDGSETKLDQQLSQKDMMLRTFSSVHTMEYKCHEGIQQILQDGSTLPHSRIAVVGTHKEMLETLPNGDDLKTKITTFLGGMEESKPYHLLHDQGGNPYFLIDNLQKNDHDYINSLRKTLSSEECALPLNIPLMWLMVELTTQRMDRKFIRYNELKRFCLEKKYINKEDTNSQFHSLLMLLHNLGFYAFYDLEGISKADNWVCTDAATLYREVSKLLVVQYKDTYTKKPTREFRRTGIIEDKNVAELFNEIEIDPEIDHHWFLNVLHRIGIATKVALEECQQYFIPLVLPFNRADLPKKTSVSTLCFTLVFSDQSGPFCKQAECNLPRGIFPYLVVHLADQHHKVSGNEMWQIDPYQSDRTHIMFDCTTLVICLIEEADHMELAIMLNENYFPSTMGLEEMQGKLHSLCRDIRQTVTTAINSTCERMFGRQFTGRAEVQSGFLCPCGEGGPHLAFVSTGSAQCSIRKTLLSRKLSSQEKIWFSPVESGVKFSLFEDFSVKFWIMEEISDTKPSRDGKYSAASQHGPITGTDHPPSDAGLQGVVNMLPDSWNSLAISLGVSLENVTAFSKKDLGGLLALQYWRDGKSGKGYDTTWTFLLKKVSENNGSNVADDLKKDAMKNYPSWWKLGSAN